MSRRLQMLQWTMVIVAWGGIVVQIFGPDHWEDIGRDVALTAMLANVWLGAYTKYPDRRWPIYVAAILTFAMAGLWLMRPGD